MKQSTLTNLMAAVLLRTEKMKQHWRYLIARWFDPTSGELQPVEGSPFANAGQRDFTPPGKNAAGDNDWVLILESKD